MLSNIIFIIEIIIGALLVFFIPWAIVKLLDKIYERKHCKNKPEERIPGSSYEEWHKLPASEVIGDFSDIKKSTKKWHNKPLTF